ncbi:MAG TPA: YkvA family protein [Chloroflexota bacterium]
MVDRLRQRARQLKRDTLALYLACRDPRTPWYAKALAGGIVAYAFSPIDLIPDFVPVFGYLDDLIIVPIGLVLATKLVPDSVMTECRERAALMTERPTSRTAAVVIMGIWLGSAALMIYLVAQALDFI